MTETTGIQYMERDGIHYPILEEEMKETEVLARLNRFGRMAAESLRANDQERYGMLLGTGMLLPRLEEVQEQAEKLYEETADALVETWMKQDNINPYDTMRMTNLRIQADMEAGMVVAEEIISQTR